MQVSYILCQSKITAISHVKNTEYLWFRYKRRRIFGKVSLNLTRPANKELLTSLLLQQLENAAQYTIKGRKMVILIFL